MKTLPAIDTYDIDVDKFAYYWGATTYALKNGLKI